MFSHVSFEQCLLVAVISLSLKHAEIFSYGAMPWSTLLDQQVIPAVQRRSKLTQPAAASGAVYEVMLGCWRLEAGYRLSAAEIEEQLVELHSQDSGSGQLQWKSKTQLLANPLSGSLDDQDTSLANESNENGWAAVVDITSAAATARFAQLELARSRLEEDGEELGEGAFGRVVRSRLKGSAMHSGVAVKMLSGEAVSEEETRKFLTEARLMAVLRHDHIVELVGVVTSGAPVMMVMELMDGDLLSHLQARGKELATGVLVEYLV